MGRDSLMWTLHHSLCREEPKLCYLLFTELKAYDLLSKSSVQFVWSILETSVARVPGGVERRGS